MTINEPGHESIKKSSVILTITDPFIVQPSKTVYLAPTSKYSFKLARVSLKNNDMTLSPISIPSKQYQWNVDDKRLGDIAEDGVFISKDKEGLASILVID